jgi:hypothetical protein
MYDVGERRADEREQEQKLLFMPFIFSSFLCRKKKDERTATKQIQQVPFMYSLPSSCRLPKLDSHFVDGRRRRQRRMKDNAKHKISSLI